MADVFSVAERSALMARIRGRDTKPEMIVRRLAHRLGYRFRLHRRELPGTPDLVFPGRRKVVFVHGCFWHAHENCRFAVRPKTRPEFWAAKLERNRTRDREAQRQLRSQGWEPAVIWECELSNVDEVAQRLRSFLGPPPAREQKTS